ncbi:putative OV-16 antigen [Hypsibius exemplaris]|uniref:OV-16 antigen n=1 Tax=Hypsibius exemplaris TaxID=2072580 RepID=A0A1W0X7N1_HYPEX|nr:putative OV-16 antigen [Hypsibius exemplaris]
MYLWAFGILGLVAVVLAQQNNRWNCSRVGNSTFERYCIIANLIDLPAPREVLEVNYTSNTTVNEGNKLSLEQVQSKPSSVQWPVDEGQFYTLIKTDSDSSSERSTINHWLLVNIPGVNFTLNITAGDEIVEYLGANPPKNTGLHRYVFLAYRQVDLLNATELSKQYSSSNRANFQIKKFALENGIGNPVAGNFYLAQSSSAHLMLATFSLALGSLFCTLF